MLIAYDVGLEILLLELLALRLGLGVLAGVHRELMLDLLGVSVWMRYLLETT